MPNEVKRGIVREGSIKLLKQIAIQQPPSPWERGIRFIEHIDMESIILHLKEELKHVKYRFAHHANKEIDRRFGNGVSDLLGDVWRHVQQEWKKQGRSSNDAEDD